MYEIIVGDQEYVERYVNEAIERGFRPIGGVHKEGHTFTQAIWRNENAGQCTVRTQARSEETHVAPNAMDTTRTGRPCT